MPLSQSSEAASRLKTINYLNVPSCSLQHEQPSLAGWLTTPKTTPKRSDLNCEFPGLLLGSKCPYDTKCNGLTGPRYLFNSPCQSVTISTRTPDLTRYTPSLPWNCSLNSRPHTLQSPFIPFISSESHATYSPFNRPISSRAHTTARAQSLSHYIMSG